MASGSCPYWRLSANCIEAAAAAAAAATRKPGPVKASWSGHAGRGKSACGWCECVVERSLCTCHRRTLVGKAASADWTARNSGRKVQHWCSYIVVREEERGMSVGTSCVRLGSILLGTLKIPPGQQQQTGPVKDAAAIEPDDARAHKRRLWLRWEGRKNRKEYYNYWPGPIKKKL